MAVRDQVTPEPGLKQLCRLQLMRYNLVNFLEDRNFGTVIQGLFVRVLLEMRAADRQAAGGPDNYYIAMVKGAHRGPSYSGFSWDGMTTEWHIVIDLPPCFRNTPNSNVVQLNSISNSPFKPAEYQHWVQMTRESGNHFITVAQIDLRFAMLQETLEHYALLHGGGRRSKKQVQAQGAPENEEERLRREIRDAQIAKMRQETDTEIRQGYDVLPALEDLSRCTPETLANLEQRCQTLLNLVRTTLNQRTKCVQCKEHYSTIVCYPCKHRVLCASCAKCIDTCPVCNAAVQDKFEPFLS